MKIEQYISQLLYRYQCVTVPGFGAFLTEIQSAQLQENTHSFFPPKKLLSFNSYLKNNDGLLASHIAQQEKMSYEASVLAIENQVVIWKNKLQDFEGIIIKNIGEIVLNADKNLVFTPTNQVNYLAESFGLSTYTSPLIKREVLKQLDVKEEDIAILTNEKEAISLNANRKSYSYLKYAAVFVLGLGVLGALGFKYNENRIATETLLVQKNVQKQVNQKIQEATFFISNPIPTVTLTVKNEDKKVYKYPYHIVAGVFKQKQNASRNYYQLVHLGYRARRIAPNKNGYFPVLYGSYSSYTAAQNALLKIQNSHNKEAWLLIEKL
ncbi:SPOR domain-containing protein [Flavobacterium sp.]|uniref:HU domain-containing protein n=1 Tax=Flavobacterium sp. TaxID=239 RepID=UPI003750C5B7